MGLNLSNSFPFGSREKRTNFEACGKQGYKIRVERTHKCLKHLSLGIMADQHQKFNKLAHKLKAK